MVALMNKEKGDISGCNLKLRSRRTVNEQQREQRKSTGRFC